MFVRIIFLSFLVVCGNCRNANKKLFSSASYKFSGQLLENVMKQKEGNVVISPYSIQKSVALSMFGAAGETLDEIKQTLNYNDFTMDELVDFYTGVTERLKNYSKFQSANKFYVMENFSLKPSYKTIALQAFDSDVENINFKDNENAANKINRWVESKTDNKIKDIVSSSLLDGRTRLVIVNAVHFKDQWLHKFETKKTRKNKFYIDQSNSVETDFMETKARFYKTYLPDIECDVVQIPYKDPEISMVVILPAAVLSPSELREKIGQIDWKRISKNLTKAETYLNFPKFKYTFDIEMKNVLKEMGTKKIFTGNAELPNLIENEEDLYLTNVIHKAFIAVDEEGTEAAGGTFSVLSSKKSLGASRIKLDRPFLYVIKAKSNILFMGAFVNPEL